MLNHRYVTRYKTVVFYKFKHSTPQQSFQGTPFFVKIPSRNGRPAREYPPTAKKLGKKRPLTKTISAARRVVRKYNEDPRAMFFLRPVNEATDGAPGYYTLITSPMDLKSILINIDNDSYTTPSEVLTDVRLVWENCRVYNRHAAWGTIGFVLLFWVAALSEEFNEDWEREFSGTTGINTDQSQWIEKRKLLQRHMVSLPQHHLHMLLCLIQCSSSTACEALKLGRCAIRCEVDVLQLSNSTIRACLTYISQFCPKPAEPLPSDGPKERRPLLAWPRDEEEDLSYDDLAYLSTT